MAQCERVPTVEAAERLGISPGELRVRMYNNDFHPPIGRVEKKKGNKHCNYYVMRPMLNRYLGIEEGEG